LEINSLQPKLKRTEYKSERSSSAIVRPATQIIEVNDPTEIPPHLWIAEGASFNEQEERYLNEALALVTSTLGEEHDICKLLNESPSIIVPAKYLFVFPGNSYGTAYTGANGKIFLYRNQLNDTIWAAIAVVKESYHAELRRVKPETIGTGRNREEAWADYRRNHTLEELEGLKRAEEFVARLVELGRNVFTESELKQIELNSARLRRSIKGFEDKL
jgi:hypothetical protein